MNRPTLAATVVLLTACGSPTRPSTNFDVPPLSDDFGNAFDTAAPTDTPSSEGGTEDVVSFTDAPDGSVATDSGMATDVPLGVDASMDAPDGESPLDASLDVPASDRPIFTFDLGTDAGPPLRNGPRLISPLSGTSTASLLPTFTWAPFTSATGYTIQFSTTRAFAAIEASFTATGTSFTPVTARSSGFVFWRVVPQLAGGSAGPPSLTWELEIGLAPGDLNGDGYSDAVVGTAARNSGAGAVAIYNGAATAPSAPSVTLPGATGEGFGSAVSSAGDINGDGYADLVVGAPFSSHAAANAGRVYVFLGGPHMATTPALTIEGPSAGAGFGSSVAILGDIDGDGFDDFAVGAPLYATSGPNTGKVWVYFGGATPSTSRFETLAFATPGDQFGRSVAAAGDVDGDGLDDVIIGAPHNVTAGMQAGQAYIYLGGAVFDFVPDIYIPGTGMNVEAGTAVAGMGDFNHDGYADVAVGAPFDTTGAPAGQVYLLYGSYPTHALVDLRLTGETGEQFGKVLAGIGDVNHDGFDDLAVGAPFNGDTGINAGHVYFFPGATSPTSVPGATLANSVGGDQYGAALASLGDFNRDGIDDFIIGAPYAPSTGVSGPGTAYLQLGSTSVPGTPSAVWRGMAADQYAGALALRWSASGWRSGT